MHRPQVPQLVVALHQGRRGGGHVDRARLGQLLHALGQADGGSHRRVFQVLVVVEGPGHHLAGVESDPHVEADAAFLLEPVAVGGQLLAQVERRRAGLPGVVLEGDGRTEERHDPVAGELVHVPVEARHPVAQDGEEAPHEVAPLLQLHGGGEAHRVHHVGEEDGDLLAFGAPGSGRLRRRGRRREGFGRSAIGRSARGLQRRVLAEHGGLQLADRLARFESELLPEEAAEVLVGGSASAWRPER